MTASLRKAKVAAQNLAKKGKTVQAVTRKVRISSKKIRPLMDSIVNKPAMQAVDILTFVPNKAARIVLKTLKSAIANAENNHNLSSATLFVVEAHIDDAQVLKRFLPVARGSAHPIKKRSSHVRIVLSEAAPKVKQTTREKIAAKNKAAKEAKKTETKGEGK